MTKEIWTLREPNLGDEEVEQLTNSPTRIYNSRIWNVIGVLIFPFLTFIFIWNQLWTTLNIATIFFGILLIVLGFMFVISIQQLSSKKPAIELTQRTFTIRGTQIPWSEIADIKFLSGIEGSNPTLKLNERTGNEHEIGLGYLTKQPKEIHTLICKYNSIARAISNRR
ncbi:MAG: hypothetical protein RIC03_00430 [Cyclobacteriaceae bacterium]